MVVVMVTVMMLMVITIDDGFSASGFSCSLFGGRDPLQGSACSVRQP